MRGKDFRDVVKVSFIRITPAHAGKRHCESLPELVDGDHPRACGEKYKSIITKKTS